MGLLIKCLTTASLYLGWLSYPNLPENYLGGNKFFIHSGINKFVTKVVCPITEKTHDWDQITCVRKTNKFLSNGFLKTDFILNSLISTGPPSVNFETHFIAGTETIVATPKSWTPETGSNIFYYHGGFHTTESIFDLQNKNFVHKLAEKTNCRVFAPDYRLSPENKFPESFDDSYAVTLQVLADPKYWNIEGDNFALIGDESGGQIAISVSMRLVMDSMDNARLLAPIYPVTGSHLFNFTESQVRNGGHFQQEFFENSIFAGLQYDLRNEEELVHLRDLMKNPIIMDKEWAEEYSGYANKYLPKYYPRGSVVRPNYQPISLENSIHSESDSYKRFSNYKKLSISEKKFINDYRNFMRDYRFGNVKMTDEYLERYLRHAPKHHFYATAENDIFRDEGLIMYHRLADLNAGIDRSSGGVVEGVDFEVFDMENVSSGVFKLSKTFGGSIGDFDGVADEWLGKVEAFMRV